MIELLVAFVLGAIIGSIVTFALCVSESIRFNVTVQRELRRISRNMREEEEAKGISRDREGKEGKLGSEGGGDGRTAGERDAPSSERERENPRESR
jgi:hypothetical protein